MRESTVEKYLHKQVVKAGGWTYKFKSPGRRNVPDRIVIWPAQVDMAECKAPGKKPRAGQVREHKRLTTFNIDVFVLDTKEKIDRYVVEVGR